MAIKIGYSRLGWEARDLLIVNPSRDTFSRASCPYRLPRSSGDAQEPLYYHAIQNGTLNTQQSNEMLFGCVNEIVTLVLVTVIIVYV